MSSYENNCAAQFRYCVFMCNRLCAFDHGELGVPNINDADVKLLKNYYREMKTVSLKMQQLYYDSITLNQKLKLNM